jgi:hypothetical protein
MAEYLPNVRFNRRGHVNSPHEPSAWFAWNDTLESLRPNQLTVNENRSAITVLRDSFRKYIINTPMQNTTLGIEILYTDLADEIKPKRIFIVKRVREDQPDQEFKIVNTARIINRHRGTTRADLPFERSGTVFRNNQLRDVVKKLRRKNILQISLCEVYHDGKHSPVNNHEYKPYTMEVKVLYRNISRELINQTFENGSERMRADAQPPIDRATLMFDNMRRIDRLIDVARRFGHDDEVRRLNQELLNLLVEYRNSLAPGEEPFPGLDEYIEGMSSEPLQNPNQLRVIPAPNPVPAIRSSSYPDVCVICQEPVVGEGCRVNCPAGHIYHCVCINGWRNSKHTNTYYDTNWHDECPLCRAPIDSMYHVDIPEGFTTGFGRRRKTTGFGKLSSRISLKTIDKWMKYLNTF